MMHTMKHKYLAMDTYSFVFGLLIALGLAFVFSSFPMMRLRFDIWDHVEFIRVAVQDPHALDYGRKNWYLTWAYVFRLMGANDIFTFATTIHRTQFILSCILIYTAAKQIYSALLPLKASIRDQNNWLSSLALSSVLVWLTIIGTFSFFQQAWIMWYSVNYQITLPMLFLSLGLMVNVLAMEQTSRQVVLKSCMALSLLLGVYLFHAGELAYLVFYIPILVVCFGSKYSYKTKNVLLLIFVVIVVLYIAISFYSDHIPALVTHLKKREFTKILTEINAKGTWNAINGGNRYAANWNELYSLSVYLFALIGVAGLVTKFKLVTSNSIGNFNLNVNKRVLSFLLLSLVFCFIPTFKYTSGLASLISYDGIVNRYYFASFVFMAIPLAGYLGVAHIKNIGQPMVLIVLVILLMTATFFYSKIKKREGVYYQNVMSIANSVESGKINIEVSDVDIENIRVQLNAAEKIYKQDKFMYCGTFESAYVAYYIFGKRNLLFNRLYDYTIKDCEDYAKKYNKLIVRIG
jgi:hypothetical protein